MNDKLTALKEQSLDPHEPEIGDSIWQATSHETVVRWVRTEGEDNGNFAFKRPDNDDHTWFCAGCYYSLFAKEETAWLLIAELAKARARKEEERMCDALRNAGEAAERDRQRQ